MGAPSRGDDVAATTHTEETTAGAEAEHPTKNDDELADWLYAANIIEGRTDRRFTDKVTVSVGDPRVHYSFSPADLTVSPDTTVVWKWGPAGGRKNVAAVDGSFRSGEPIDEVRHEFEQSFSDPGVYRYVSEPQEACGMRGVVRVLRIPDSDYPDVALWLADVEHFDGTVVDQTGRDRPTVTVGDPAVNDGFSFSPPAIRVDPGTTVVWEWTGRSGPHDIAFAEADIEGAELTADPDATFEHTFQKAGLYRYFCRPHQGITQKGAIVVE